MTTNNSTNNRLTQTNTTTGTGNMVGATAPTITFPTITAVSTNSNAAAGVVGETITATVSTDVTMTSGTAITIVSINLTAGDWDLNSNITFDVGTSLSYGECGISSTTNTLPNSEFTSVYQSTGGDNFELGLACPPLRVSITGNTTYYAVAKATFTGTCGGLGQMQARRRR